MCILQIGDLGKLFNHTPYLPYWALGPVDMVPMASCTGATQSEQYQIFGKIVFAGGPELGPLL